MIRKFKLHSLKHFLSLFLVGIGLSVALAACASPSSLSSSGSPQASASGSSEATGKPIELTLVSYAVTQAAYEQIIPKFTAQWKSEHNQDVTFNQSYGGSGSQARAVIDGLDADVVALALAGDVKKIEKAGLINQRWEKKAPNNAIVTHSVDAIVTRPGNPKGIKTWEDLTKGDVKIITANPKTSGGARWNFLALWGSVTQTGGDEAKALDFTTKIFKNVPVMPKDSRETSDVFFKQGQGDVLINYENEVLLAKSKGQDVTFVIPTDVNVSIDSPVAVVDKNVDKHGTREIAEAFVKFLYTPEAQKEFGDAGFRPVDEKVAQTFAEKYPKVSKLFTVQDFGGWSQVQSKFFDDGGVFDQIQAKVGA